LTDSPVGPLAERVDPDRVSLLLHEAGWRVVGQRQGSYVRMSPPGEFRASVLVPLDRTAPEFAMSMQDALSDIERITARDIEASNISARLIAEPTDGFRFRTEAVAPRGLIPWTQGERLIQNARLALSTGAKTYMETLSYFGNRYGQFANRYLDKVLMGQTAPGSYVVSAFVPSSALVPLTKPQVATEGRGPLPEPNPDEMASTRLIGIATWAAMAATVEAVTHYREAGSASAFEDLVSRGVSHEMTTALRGLVEGSEGTEISVEWDPAVPVPDEMPPATIKLRPTDVEILNRVSSELLAKAAVPERVTFTGWVHLLAKKEAGGPGVIGVTNITYEKPVKIRVRLSDDDYHRALIAHDEDRAIVVEGVIEREGNIYWMYQGRLVRVLAISS